MSNEELIAEARARAEHPETGSNTAQCLRELADTLEAVTTPSPDHVKAVADTLMRVHAYTTIDPLELAKACTLLAAHHHEDCPATVEPEWEYRARTPTLSSPDSKTAENARAVLKAMQKLGPLRDETEPVFVERRRKAGKWVPVGGESSAE